MARQELKLISRVAPCAGAWVEIKAKIILKQKKWSLPVRERGLKWILSCTLLIPRSRSLCGSVD